MRECASKCVSVHEGVRFCVCVCEYVHMLVSERGETKEETGLSNSWQGY